MHICSINDTHFNTQFKICEKLICFRFLCNNDFLNTEKIDHHPNSQDQNGFIYFFSFVEFYLSSIL